MDLAAGFKPVVSGTEAAEVREEFERFLRTYRVLLTPGNHEVIGLAFRAGWYRRGNKCNE